MGELVGITLCSSLFPWPAGGVTIFTTEVLMDGVANGEGKSLVTAHEGIRVTWGYSTQVTMYQGDEASSKGGISSSSSTLSRSPGWLSTLISMAVGWNDSWAPDWKGHLTGHIGATG